MDIATRPFPAKHLGTPDACDYVRLVGDEKTARLETAPPYGSVNVSLEAFEPQPIDAQVSVDEKGITTIVSDYLDDTAAKYLASEYRRLLLDACLVVPEMGNRYLVGQFRSYAKLDRVSAELLANHLNMSIEVTEGVEIVHATKRWALWSDGTLTTATGLPTWVSAINSLSADAADIIDTFVGSDTPRLYVGLDNVMKVAEITAEHTESLTHDGGIYAPKRIKRLAVLLRDGSTETWWLHTVGYLEGYAYDLYSSREALVADVYPEPKAPATPDYTPKLGQLWEPCGRCGEEPVYMPLHLCERCWPRP